MPTLTISSDSHVIEPPDLWSERLPRELRVRGPQVQTLPNGTDWWIVDGAAIFPTAAKRKEASPAASNPQAPRRMRNILNLERGKAHGHPGGYDPAKKIEAMDQDGVFGEVVFPSLGIPIWRLPDSALLSAICAAYNDWVAEFVGEFPTRLRGVAMINTDDPDVAVKELTRAAGMGLVGAMITCYPGAEKSFDRSIYEQFWAAAADLQMPLAFHLGTNREVAKLGLTTSDTSLSPFNTVQAPSDYTSGPFWVQLSFSQMLFAGVFERHPGLKVVSLEQEAAWAATFVKLMDYTYTERSYRSDWYRFKSSALPSDFFHQSCFISFQEDALGIRLRDIIGIDNLMWGSDFPHPEGTWPDSQTLLDRNLQGVPPEERLRITGKNAAKVYRFDIN